MKTFIRALLKKEGESMFFFVVVGIIIFLIKTIEILNLI